MAAKKDKTTMWILLLGGGAAVWYFMSKNNAAASTTTTTAATAQASSLPVPVTSVIPPVMTTATQTAAAQPLISTSAGTGTTLQPSGVPYDSRMDTLQTWAQNSLNACDLSRWNSSKSSFTQDEWNGLFDIYFNDWIGGQGTTSARTQFWNAWRVKYSILTLTPC